MKPTSHHYIALIISVIVLAASVAAYFFIDVQTADQAMRTAKAFTTVADEQAIAGQEKTATMALSSTADARALLQTYLISSSQTVYFIEQVESVSKESSSTVSIASISADDLTSAAPGTIGHIQAHISITGSWPEAMRAFHILEDLPYSISIDGVTAHAQGRGVWDVEFNLASLIVK